MARRHLRQFLLLLWKNYTLQKRKLFMTCLEIGAPLLFAIVLISIRAMITPEPVNQPTEWNEFEIAKFPHNLNMSHFVKAPWNLLFTPYNNDTEAIMQLAKDVFFDKDILSVISVDNETALVKSIMDCLDSSSEFNPCGDIGGIVFENTFPLNMSLSTDVKYKIRLAASGRYNKSQDSSKYAGTKITSWLTDRMFPSFELPGPREISDDSGGPPGYRNEGFLTIQQAVNWAIVKYYNPGTDLHENINLKLRRFPYPPYNGDKFVIVLQNQFPMFIMLSLILTTLTIVKDVVNEKEKRLKEAMRLMGLSSWLHWCAWFLKYFIFIIITISLMVGCYSASIGSHGKVLGHTDPSVMFVFLVLYAIATINFSFAVSVFFSKANSGAAGGGIFFFLTYLPYFFLQPRYNSLSLGTKITTSLFSNVAMAFGTQVIGMFEGLGSGVQWSNVCDPVSVDDNFSLLHVFIMLLVDAIFYGLITWYVEAVFPGEFGVPQRWFFPVQKSYWFGHQTADDQALLTEVFESSSHEQPVIDVQSFEAEPMGLPTGISIAKLKKVFGSGEHKKVAVSDMTLNMYKGQITALLGHNGAGKTTTMSMLTGFIPVTSGTAIVNGCDIRTDIAGVRESLGLCPQYNILYDSLTVEEHLYFFARLKGCAGSKVNEEIDRLLSETKLKSKRYMYASTLSGGMKRKLCVAIALIGGSEVVILDEPTTGMDPDARSHTWSLLQRERAGRTILLTTHFMDEADLLGDRIAIMAEGVIQCCGSSMYLKKKYGAGYHMVMVKNTTCSVSTVTELVQSFVSSAELESNVGAELSYILPQESVSSFQSLFNELDDKKATLGIATYGVSVTTLEEVFLRVGEDNDDTLKEKLHLSMSSKSGEILQPLFNINLVRDSGAALWAQRMRALLVKRFLHSLRNRVLTICQLLIPMAFTLIALIVLKTLPDPSDSPPIVLSTESLVHNTVAYSHTAAPPLGEELAGDFSQSLPHHDKARPQDVFDLDSYLLHEGKVSVSRYSRQFLVAALYESYAAEENNQVTSNVSNIALIRQERSIVDEELSDTKIITDINLAKQNNYVRYMRHFNKESSDSFSKNTAKMTSKTMQQIPVDEEIRDGKVFHKDISNVKVISYFNNQGYHTPAIALSAVFNGISRTAGLQTNNTPVTITTTNHPLPRTSHDIVAGKTSTDFRGFILAIHVVIGMAFLSGSFALFIVREREVRAKHSQLVSGGSVPQYWMSTFVWDMFNYIIPCILLLIIFASFDIHAYCDGHRLGLLLFLLFLYGWASLPLMYNLSRLFSIPASAFVWLSMFNLFSGVISILAIDILQFPGIDKRSASSNLEWFCVILLPNAALGLGLQDIYTNYLYLELCSSDFVKYICQKGYQMPCCIGNCGNTCATFQNNYLAWEASGIGRHLVFLFLQGVFYFIVLLTTESGWLRALWYQVRRIRTKCGDTEPVSQPGSIHSLIQEDEDISDEHKRVYSNPLNVMLETDAMVIKGLTKKFGDLVAVDSMSIGIPRGECFGLLGTNGAGKTTTFKMLTGDETVTKGNAYIDGYDIKNSIRSVQKRLGYCPQFDALIDEMTGRETLYLYARLRGVCESLIPGVVESISQAVLLQDHIDRQAHTYSGGNKRKLSTAIALIGDPPVIFLDEPTSGMDPVARRLLWDTLSRIRASGRTLVLTSHSMEECEALCTRLAIMVNGGLKCLGSTQHLKNKFGEGYTVLIKVQKESDVHDMTRYIENRFVTAVLKDVHQCMMHYHVSDDPENRITLSGLFGAMEGARSRGRYKIEDYSISQTTLEQVFVNFARSQEEPQVEQNTRCFTRCLGYCCYCCSNDYLLMNDDSTRLTMDDDDLDSDDDDDDPRGVGDTNPLVQNV